MVHLLWAATAGMKPEQAQQTCETLADLSLITMRWADHDHQVVVVHDAVRAFLRSPDGLGERRGEVNQRLLDQAGEVLGIGDGHWWHLPKGHFLWDHLAFADGLDALVRAAQQRNDGDGGNGGAGGRGRWCR